MHRKAAFMCARSEGPSIDIRLPSGLLLRDAPRMLRDKFNLWPWSRYDGIALADPFRITDQDVDASFSIGARNAIKREEYKRGIHAVHDELTRFLQKIPPDSALENPNLDMHAMREPIVGLLNCLTGVSGAKLANATKILHRFRPKLLPVIDSVLQNYYWYAISMKDEARFIELTRSWKGAQGGEYAYLLMQLFRDDLCAVMPQLLEVRDAVERTAFAAASPVRILEGLIWYYYAGR